MQLAWIMCDDKGNIIEERSDIIKPEGFSIPVEASSVHGITTIKAGHNISFDECIVGAEFERKRMMTSLFLKPKYCTMKMSTNYCKLPGGKQGFKSPKLSELHQVLFGEGSENAHDALADVRATVRCFWKLKELKVI